MSDRFSNLQFDLFCLLLLDFITKALQAMEAKPERYYYQYYYYFYKEASIKIVFVIWWFLPQLLNMGLALFEITNKQPATANN